MGLLGEGINEVIATTSGNAAPIGIICRDAVPRMVLFRGSHTAENVLRDGWIVANFVYDPVVWVRTAFEDLPAEAFRTEAVDGTSVQRLVDAEAWIAFAAEVERSTQEAHVVRLTLLREAVEDLRLHPVNRGFASIIDATVHATRYVRTGDPHLRRLIDHHASLVRKCGGRREWEALDLLQGYIAKQAPE
ncbi:DUF447 family protein [Methanoculleus sp. FWC-SCC1]|uniref:DUF447 family protein n=1 Tax=Methanoculleus frigidifontis TaxID=2584085 RepID=A0ABT8MDJ1_9EURY|nr:DUF447 domain-containing protein [Methanoculleus sp. FWC-SCC1]MDN7025991.1 DUF447 family protein [Methanoculleus sp. FWC-SCC1]